MSWQRILEVARQQGMPVVVTDIAGREPMVILPFEKYERLLEQESPTPFAMEDEEEYNDGGPIPSLEEFESEALEENVEKITSSHADDFQKKTANRPVESESEPEQSNGLAIEERFYLEPIEDPKK